MKHTKHVGWATCGIDGKNHQQECEDGITVHGKASVAANYACPSWL